MNHFRPDSGAEVKAHAADEARVFVALGGMADQVRWFVDDQQFGIFVNYFEEVVHMRMAAS